MNRCFKFRTGMILDTLNSKAQLKIMRLLFLFLFIAFIGRTQYSPDVFLTPVYSDQVNAMAIAPDGKFLASASNDKQMKIWDLSKGMEFRPIAGTDGCLCEQRTHFLEKTD